MIRMCRHVTGRPRIAVFNWCYHGSVDESFVTLVAFLGAPGMGGVHASVLAAMVRCRELCDGTKSDLVSLASLIHGCAGRSLSRGWFGG